MAATISAAFKPRNRLLAALPPEDIARLRPHLEPVKVVLRQVIQEPSKPISAVYFPENGWISMIALLANGDAAEVGIIGREGMLGIPLLLGDDRSLTEGVVQAPGRLLRIRVRTHKHLGATRGVVIHRSPLGETVDAGRVLAEWHAVGAACAVAAEQAAWCCACR